MRRWRGLKNLVHDAVDHTTNLVEETQESVAGRTFGIIELFEPVTKPAKTVNLIRKITSAGVYGSIHGVNHIVKALGDEGLELVEKASSTKTDEGPPIPMRSDATSTTAWAADTALGALNGVIGDYLHESGNELDVKMCLRHGDDYLQLDEKELKSKLPEATSKLVIFVHGLTCTEWAWCSKAQEYYGDATTNFGSMMRRDFGHTPLYVRYNTGLHISANGTELARQLELLSRFYPRDIEELVLIGHSMGGLVIRSACQYAANNGQQWLEPLTHVMSIATPHRGAPLEKLGNVATSVLGFFDTPGTQIPAKLINVRSAGIKDLRFGYLTDEDWLGKDPDALLENTGLEVPLLDDVTYSFLSGSLTDSPNHPVGFLIGDALVRRPSAEGPKVQRGDFRIETRHFGGLGHLQLQNHPDVYEEIRRIYARETVDARH